MMRITKLEELAPGSLGPTAVAIGIFDGVHRGHQEILRRTADEARELGVTPIALTFDVLPETVLKPDRAPAYICTLAQRAGYIRQLGGGIDHVVAIHFTHEFAALDAQEFVERYLVGVLSARKVFVGRDFHFGKGRAGDKSTLEAEGTRLGFDVEVAPAVTLNGVRISSTQVREQIRAGDVQHVRELLGHPFELMGTVVEGKHLGRQLGFPTANMEPVQAGQVLPGDGVYAALGHTDDGRTHRAAVSIGSNPTTDTHGLPKVEAYLMDGFEADLYGQPLVLSFQRKLRDQIRFANLDDLVDQIRLDIESISAGLAPNAWV